MQLDPVNFLTHIKNLVTGDRGYFRSAEVDLASLKTSNSTLLTDSSAGTANTTIQAMPDPTDAPGTADALRDDLVAVLIPAIRNNFADVALAINNLIRANRLTADETNARVYLVEETEDSIGHIVWHVPMDYDETNDDLRIRVLASQLTSSTDDDVEVDAELYRKRPGAALSADLGPTTPGTVLSTTEQWIEITATGLGLQREDVAIIELISNGANDTDGEEILIHAVELRYRSTLVGFTNDTTRG